MYNLFLIQTPFQLFNATEAAHRFHEEEKNILIFIDKGNQKNRQQIEKILEYDNSWHEVVVVPFSSKIQRLVYPFTLTKHIKIWNSNKINNIYVALYRNISAHIVNSVKHKHTIVYDDGNSIFKTIHFLNEKKQKTFKVMRALSDVITLRKTDIDFLYKSILFTLFDISSYKNIDNKIIQNDFSYFKSKIKTLKEENDIFFIGSKMIDNGMTKDIFEASVQNMVQFYKLQGIKVKYVPHRYEDIAYLESLSNKYGFKVTPFSSIIEFEFITQGVKPSEVATFRSTAVDTLNIIYGTKVTIFTLKKEEIAEDKQEEFDLVYQNFRKKQYIMREIVCE